VENHFQLQEEWGAEEVSQGIAVDHEARQEAWGSPAGGPASDVRRKFVSDWICGAREVGALDGPLLLRLDLNLDVDCG